MFDRKDLYFMFYYNLDIGSGVLGTGMWCMEKEAGFAHVEFEACLGGPGGFW